MNSRKIIFVLVSLSLLVSMGCAKDAVTATSSTTLSSTVPVLAVTSPTAGDSTALTSLKNQGFWARLGRWLLPLSLAETAPETLVEPFDTMVAEIVADLASGTAATIAADIGSMTVTSYRAPCYGPGWTDTTNRPTGDLGFVAANASDTDTTACAAAELNSLIGGAPQFANKLITLEVAMIAALRAAGTGLPAVGATVDALSVMPTVTGLTVTAATLSRLADRASDGRPVYKTVLSFTDTATSLAGSGTVWHTPVNDANTNYIGLIQAVLPHTASMGGAGTKRGLSMVYEQSAGVLTYALDTAANRATNSADFFNATTGRVDYTKTAFGEDGNRIIAQFNTTTNATTMHYAWQAGENDGAVRAFGVTIPAGTDGALTGTAYFGFGPDIDTLTDDVTTPWMTKMHCNWLNGLATGPSLAKVQKQTMTQSGGIFTSTTTNISFAPTDTCDGTFTITNSTPTIYNGTRTVTANDLIAKASISLPVIAVPSYPVPTE